MNTCPVFLQCLLIVLDYFMQSTNPIKFAKRIDRYNKIPRIFLLILSNLELHMDKW